ncbi:MAG: 30S ribosomal protein S6 [Candidatus Aminicenantaceae bacterium]
MRQYETAFLIAPNLPEEDNEKLVSQMAEVVSKKKGNMINVDEWGKRKLAYPIQKFEEAYYVFFLYEGDPSIPVELERRFKQTEAIIRYMTVKNEITESARKRGRASTKKKRVAAGVKEEKIRKKEEAPEKVSVKDLEKEPKEKPAEKLIEEPAEKPVEEPKEAPEKETKAEQDKELKAKSKEEPKAEPKEEQKEKQNVEMETELKEKPKEKSKEDLKEEPKAESKDKAEEKPQEKLPPEDKEKKEK